MSVTHDSPQRVTPSLDASHDAAASEQSRQPVSPAGDARGLAGVAVFSDSAARLAAFYGMLLGVRFEHRVHADGRDHRIAEIAGLKFEIKATHAADGERTVDAPRATTTATDGGTESSSIELSFSVPDAAASFAYALTLGAFPLIAVETQAWGAFGTVLDLDGNRVGLYSETPTSSDGDR